MNGLELGMTKTQVYGKLNRLYRYWACLVHGDSDVNPGMSTYIIRCMPQLVNGHEPAPVVWQLIFFEGKLYTAERYVSTYVLQP